MGDAGYVVEEQWHSQPRHMRVICIGAGAAGLMVAYKLQRSCKNFDIVLYDKNPDIGGTWYENRYPGCACDVPAHVYTYPFEPNPNWSQFYAGSAEIHQYFVKFAEKYKLNQYIRLNHKITSAQWIEDKGIYEVDIDAKNGKIKDWAHILINATGTLNNWKWPDIPGLHDFKGTLVHSANWDPSISYENKKVAVIGTGSSAIQIIPKIQLKASQLVTFMRSVTWISPPIAEDMLKDTNAEADTIGADDRPQHKYTDEEIRRFHENPEEFLAYRKELETRFNTMFDVFIAGSDVSKQAQKGMREEMLRRIGPGNEDLKQHLIPTWPPGCRRLTPGEGYLEALTKDNVARVYDEIKKITPRGLEDVAGKLHEVDIIVAATGFDTSFKPPFRILGVDGIDMCEEFDRTGIPNVYLSMTVPKFPNYFTINGFRGSWATGTALNSHEACVNYIVQCFGRIQRENIRALEVEMEIVESLYEHIDEWHKRSVWNADCKSWYKSNTPERKLIVWAGSNLHFLKSLEFVRWEHYKFRYNTSNPWAFLGNGRVKAEISKEIAKLTPYIRNADEPWSID